MLFEGHRFCPHCGAKTDEPAAALPETGATPRFCPRCGGGGKLRLESQPLDSQLLDTCVQCRGIFVDNDLLERLLAERRYRDPPTSGSWHTGPPQPTKTDAYIRCPDCDRQMLRRNYARKSGVVVDVCLPHGVWFDAAELERVIAFVQSGGLDQARGQGDGLSQTPGMDATLKSPLSERDRQGAAANTHDWNLSDDKTSVLRAIADVLSWQFH